MGDDQRRHAVKGVEDRIDRATVPDEGPKYADGPDRREETDGLESEQRREANDSGAVGPAVGVASNAQTKGLLIGSVVGGVIGLVLFLPLTLIDSGLPTLGRMVLVGIVGALVGGTAGAVYLGGRLPELEGETVDADGQPSRGSTPRDPSTDTRGR